MRSIRINGVLQSFQHLLSYRAEQHMGEVRKRVKLPYDMAGVEPPTCWSKVHHAASGPHMLLGDYQRKVIPQRAFVSLS
jgi:hypothetical protein